LVGLCFKTLLAMNIAVIPFAILWALLLAIARH